MPFIGNKPSAVPLTSADIADGIITSAKIVDGTIVSGDINASAAIPLSKLSTTGTADATTFLRGDGAYTAVSSGVVKKIHVFSFNTRTAGNTGVADQFTFTSSFTPLDAVNNTLIVQSIVPAHSLGNDFAGYGIRFTGNTTSTNYDNFGKGTQYVGHVVTQQSISSNIFTISANTMTNQTYTIKLRTETANSQHEFYCLNSTDEARVATQTTAFLIITEFAN